MAIDTSDEGEERGNKNGKKMKTIKKDKDVKKVI